ncbi:MAG: flippase [Ignavibacteria bacterium]|nr:flippase [Ignavibacteria bacterium]
MSTAKRVLKNTGYLTIGQIFTLGFGIVWMALFSRYVGPEELGKYAFAQSTIAIVALFVELGLQSLVIRNVSQNKAAANIYYNNTIFIKAFLSVFIYGIFVPTIMLLGWDRDTLQIMIAVILTTTLYSINLAAIAIFYAFEKMKYDAIGQIINSLLTLLGVLIGIKLKLNLVGIIYLIAFASTVRLLVNIWQLHKIAEFNISINPRLIKYNFIKKTITESLPFAVLTLIGVLYNNIIIIFLRRYTNDHEVGIFSAAQKMNGFLFIVPQMFMNAIFPTLSSIYKESKERMTEIYRLAYKTILVLSFPFATFIICFSKQIIMVVYGIKYFDSILPFQLLALIIFNSVGYVNGAALNAIGEEKYFTKMFGFTVILTLILSILFIPKYGVVAASLILVFGAFLGFVIYSRRLFVLLGIKYPKKTLLKVSLISLLLGFTIYVEKIIIEYVLIEFLISLFVFSILFFLIKPFETEDIKLFEKFIPTKYARLKKYILKSYIKKVA